MISDGRRSELLFPFDVIREEQNRLVLLTDAAIRNHRNLIVHAPTGLGKTAATLSPALAVAIEKNLTILFLTSRHTQHKIALETLSLIKHKFGNDFASVSIIGKKWMCLQPGIPALRSSEFIEYCRKLREEKKCDFYLKCRKNPNTFHESALKTLKILLDKSPLPTEEVIHLGGQHQMCPYELSLGMAQKSKVIITDYYYLFNPEISDSFLLKINKELDKLIVIVDEAHNLPYRLKDLASVYLSSVMIIRSISEAKKFGYDNIKETLEGLLKLLDEMVTELKIGGEKLVNRADFEKKVEAEFGYEQLQADLKYIGDEVRIAQKRSYIGSVADFLKAWLGTDEGFVRIISVKKGFREPYILLSYRCLDPSIICKNTINNTHSTILMSGTLLPTSMYKELLGVENVQEVVFKDPFPKDNRLNLIIPQTTTKFTFRNDQQYQNIASVLSKLIKIIPGNTAVFFPSYIILDQVYAHFASSNNKTLFKEVPNLTKQEKLELIDSFKSYAKHGAVLFAAASGSFGEGIDLPGDYLKAVIIVGLPLNQPDLETKALIEYFDKKFKKGWDYGYMYPAFNKSLQNAGRCIRSETDKGIIIFLDERYVWNNYKRCFPEDWDIQVSSNFTELVDAFFRT